MIDLDGAIDLHVHTAPDVYPRSLDDRELVRAAEHARMRAILLKSHHTLTADRATLAAQDVSLPVFGGLALNLTVGGLNPAAVETAIAFGARQIWMPTIHAQHCLTYASQEMFQAEARKGYAGLSIFNADGAPIPALLPILELIRDADIALGTGHLAPAESLALLQYARDLGLKRLLVTHPLMSFTRFTTAQLEQAVALGAFLEFDALSCHPNWPQAMPADATAAAIQHVGPEHCVIASDGGQAANPTAPNMLLDFAHRLAAAGLPADAFPTLMHDNPAYLLDL